MRAWRDRHSAPQRITSLMVVFDPTGVLSCFCFTVFSLSVSLSRGRFTPSACHRSEKNIVKFFSLLRNALAQLQSAVVVLRNECPKEPCQLESRLLHVTSSSCVRHVPRNAQIWLQCLPPLPSQPLHASTTTWDWFGHSMEPWLGDQSPRPVGQEIEQVPDGRRGVNAAGVVLVKLGADDGAMRDHSVRVKTPDQDSQSRPHLPS